MTIEERSTADDVVHLRLPGSGEAWSALAGAVRGLSGATRVLVVWVDRDSTGGRTTIAAASQPDVSRAQQQSAQSYLHRADLLSVAVVDGPISGAGLGVVLACDLRVLSAQATFEVTAGAGYEIFGSLGRLAALAGFSRALELCVTGRRMSAAEASAVGLANLVVPMGELVAAVGDLVAALLTTPRAVATEMKALLTSSALEAVDDAARRRRLEAELQAAVRVMRDDE